MMKGLDLLGLGSRHWNVRDTIKVLQEQQEPIAIGCFDGGHGSWPESFGDPRKHLNHLVATDKVSAVRVHIWWDKYHATDHHSICPMDKLSHRLSVWQKWHKNHAGVKLFISHSCEYSEKSVPEISKRVAAIKTLCPSAIPVCCPLGGAPSIAGIVSEEHGKNASAAPGQIASADGQSLYDIDASKWIRRNHGAEITFAWSELCNCSESHNTFPPNLRTASPDANHLRGLLSLFESPANPPSPQFSGRVISITRPFLYKSFAEDMQKNNSRDNKPLLICNAGAPHAEVITCTGEKLGTFPIFGKPGDYPGNLTRYYSGLPGGMSLMGFEIAALAKEKSGSPYVWFKVGNQIFGSVHPSFRAGFFQ